jgi:hypothetical protein
MLGHDWTDDARKGRREGKEERKEGMWVREDESSYCVPPTHQAQPELYTTTAVTTALPMPKHFPELNVYKAIIRCFHILSPAHQMYQKFQSRTDSSKERTGNFSCRAYAVCQKTSKEEEDTAVRSLTQLRNPCSACQINSHQRCLAHLGTGATTS